MKNIVTKIMSIASTAAMLTASASFMPISNASAAGVPALNLSAKGDYYVPASALETGDYTVRVKVYFEPTENNIKYDTASVSFISDSDVGIANDANGNPVRQRNIIFKNTSDPSTKATTRNLSYKGTTFKMQYQDFFCFGQLNKVRSGYSYNIGSGSATSNRYAEARGENIGLVDPMKYDGNGGVYFTLSRKASANSGAEKITYSTADGSLKMEKLQTGDVRFTYSYIDQKSFTEREASVMFRSFDENGKKDTNLDGDSDNWIWTNASGAEYFGDKDEFTLCEVDAVVQKGTAKGDYTISLDPEKTALTYSTGEKNENGTEKRVRFELKSGTLTANKATIHIVDDADMPEPTTEPSQVTPATEPTTEPSTEPTTKSSKKLGDTNNDGKIDSKDAVNILKDYAEIIVNGSSNADKEVYDVNGDGAVNSNDAVVILKFYAEQLADIFKGSLEEYVKK